MALRRSITQRLYNIAKTSQRPSASSPIAVAYPHFDGTSSLVMSNAASPTSNSSTESAAASDPSASSETGFFRRFLHGSTMNSLPEFLSLPVGDRLREKLMAMNKGLAGGNRLRLDGISPPVPAQKEFSVEEARKLLRIAQVEKLKRELKAIESDTITRAEYARICVRSCENEEQGSELAHLMDVSGNVIVFGNTVFLKPEQVARTMESLIFRSVSKPGDPRRRELEEMEKQKGAIDEKAKSLVRAELYGGLGFMVLQTMGFMRLTFWELSWDVMEPICFFVTSLHFAAAYAFFLRTSTEPSFEGYYQRRFKTKQKKLMQAQGFDLDKYNELCKAFYPANYSVNDEQLSY